MNKPLKSRIITGDASIQGSDAWKAFRRFKIGASIAPVICGVSPWQTPLQLYDEIISGKEKSTSAAMQRGKDLEDEARQKLNELTGFNFAPAVITHPSLDWHYSSLDGLVLDNHDDADIAMVCEIKCPGFQDHAIALTGKVPEKYMPQCLHILEDVPEASCLIYASYYDGVLAIVNVDRDVDAMAVQLVKERCFYDQLCNLEEPEPTEMDWVHLENEEALQLSERFKAASDAYEATKSVLESLRSDILKKVGQNARTRIGNVKVQKILRKGLVQYSKIPELKMIDLDAYRSNSMITWRLTV